MVLLTGFGLGCIAIQIVVLVRDFWQYTVARLFACLLAMGGVLLLMPMLPREWHWFAWDITTATPAVFWALCQKAFSEKPNWRSAFTFMACYSFIAPCLTRSMGAADPSAGALHVMFWALPQYLEYVLVANGLWTIVSHWSSDLVEARRRLRASVLCLMGGVIFVVTFSLNSGFATEMMVQLVVTLSALFSAIMLLNGRMNILSATQLDQEHVGEEDLTPILVESELEQVEVDNAYSLACIKLQTLMEDGFYRTENLTLKRLAQELGIPQYKTRALINEELGYRNFNDYINQLRIAEASTRLRGEPETPVLNIALDVGYRNISSFNRTFKDMVKLTPTEFRLAKDEPVKLSQAQI